MSQFTQDPAVAAVPDTMGVTPTPRPKLVIDYKNVDDLRRLMTGNGKIVSRKRAGATAKDQKRIAQAIKRARFMALLPYSNAMG